MPEPRTHCRNGHLWTPENTALTARGRVCVTCRTERQHRHRPVARPQGKRVYLTDDEIKEILFLSIAKGWSSLDVALEIGCNESTVRYWSAPKRRQQQIIALTKRRERTQEAP